MTQDDYKKEMQIAAKTSTNLIKEVFPCQQNKHKSYKSVMYFGDLSKKSVFYG